MREIADTISRSQLRKPELAAFHDDPANPVARMAAGSERDADRSEPARAGTGSARSGARVVGRAHVMREHGEVPKPPLLVDLEIDVRVGPPLPGIGAVRLVADPQCVRTRQVSEALVTPFIRS